MTIKVAVYAAVPFLLSPSGFEKALLARGVYKRKINYVIRHRVRSPPAVT